MKINLILCLLSASLLTAPAIAAAPAYEAKAVTVTTPAFTVVMAQIGTSNSLRVAIQKHQAEHLKVAIRDAQGQVIYHQGIGKRQPGRHLKLDLSNLSDGTYTVEFTGSGQQIVKSIQLNSPATARPVVVH